MPAPASYNETTLAAYMVQTLGDLATTLGITTAAMAEAVIDVALACGVTDVADATDVAQVRALARVAALRRAQTAAASWYDFAADGGDYKRSQVMAQLDSLLKAAEADAMNYSESYAVGVGTLSYAGDPYDWDADGAPAEGAG